MGHYDCGTAGERLVHEHTGLSFKEIDNLPLDAYLRLRRDAYIYKLNQTDGGREYLDKCWTLEQTEPDRHALRQKFGR